MRLCSRVQALFAPLAVAMYGRLASQHLLKVPADAAPQLPPVPGFGAAPMWLLVRPLHRLSTPLAGSAAYCTADSG